MSYYYVWKYILGCEPCEEMDWVLIASPPRHSLVLIASTTSHRLLVLIAILCILQVPMCNPFRPHSSHQHRAPAWCQLSTYLCTQVNFQALHHCHEGRDHDHEQHKTKLIFCKKIKFPTAIQTIVSYVSLTLSQSSSPFCPRLVQGLVLGPCFPILNPLTNRWHGKVIIHIWIFIQLVLTYSLRPFSLPPYSLRPFSVRIWSYVSGGLLSLKKAPLSPFPILEAPSDLSSPFHSVVNISLF